MDGHEAAPRPFPPAPGSTRRRFLAGAGAGAAGAVLAGGPALLPGRALALPAQAQAADDDGTVRFAASTEFAAVEFYRALSDSGKLRTQAIVDAIVAFARHHQQHGEALVTLADAGVTANRGLLDMFGGRLTDARDERAAVEVAYRLENALAATYLSALGTLTDTEAVETSASILPVEAQHAVALGAVLGKPLTDRTFMPDHERRDGALDPAEFPLT